MSGNFTESPWNRLQAPESKTDEELKAIAREEYAALKSAREAARAKKIRASSYLPKIRQAKAELATRLYNVRVGDFCTDTKARKIRLTLEASASVLDLIQSNMYAIEIPPERQLLQFFTLSLAAYHEDMKGKDSLLD